MSLTRLALCGVLTASGLVTACSKPNITDIGMNQRHLSYVAGTARKGSTSVEVQWRQLRFVRGGTSGNQTWHTLGFATVHGGSWSLSPSSSIDLMDGVPDPNMESIRTDFRVRSFDAQGRATEWADVADHTKFGKTIGAFGATQVPHDSAVGAVAAVTAGFVPVSAILNLERLNILVADGPDMGTGPDLDMQTASVNVSTVRAAFPWIDDSRVDGALMIGPWSAPSAGGYGFAFFPGASRLQVGAPFNAFGNAEYPFVLGMVTLWAPGYAGISSSIAARSDLADIQIDVTETTLGGALSRRGVSFSGALRSSGFDLY